MRENQKLRIIDAHANIGRDYWREKIRRYPCKISANQLLSKMEKYGIDKAIVLPCPTGKYNVCPNKGCNVINKFMNVSDRRDFSYILQCPACKSKIDVKHEPFESKNKTLFKACRANKGKLFPFIAVDWRHPKSLSYLKNAIKNEDVYGIKFYALTLAPDSAEALLNTEIMDIVSANKLNVMFHTSTESQFNPLTIVKLAKRYKENNFIVAHCARLHKQFLKEAKRLKNVFIETSLASMISDQKLKYYDHTLNQEEREMIKKYSGLYAFLIKEVGVNKILFGTDIPAISEDDLQNQIMSFKNMSIEKEQLEDIAYNNAARILRL